ncbi:GLUG motif-containing protein [Candidatus Agathobaculum pullicola]|uniref:GLUG motif-containing protein n=1 Tax=Candidatus Agathobaculum pullicola TaxID=2838426 RepID=UPI003F8FD807
MKKIPSKFLCLLLAGIMLLSILAPIAEAAGEGIAVSVSTVEDLLSLSQSCALDSWSHGKTVRLEADIDLSNIDFTPIPTFGGTFEGGGHTISGLALTESGNVRGLFRYIQSTGVVRNLTIEGCINPSGQKDALGGLVGNNRGVVTNVSFVGSVSGTNYIGGIAGVNEAEGQIINCSFSGTVTGEHYVGGIVGQNHGTVIRCENQGSINTTEVNAEVRLDDLSRTPPNATENVPVCTDIGGIAGFSSGILQSCTNDGAVGYAHMGYNTVHPGTAFCTVPAAWR